MLQVAKLDLTYLLMHAWPMDAFLANYPGRRYLFDMGTSTFDTSLRFLTDKYRQVRHLCRFATHVGCKL